MNTEFTKERFKSFTPIDAGWTFKGLVSNDDGSITVSSLPIIGVAIVETKFKRDGEIEDSFEFVVVDGGQLQTQGDVHQEWYEGINTYPIGPTFTRTSGQ